MHLPELEARLISQPDLSSLTADEQFALLKERAKHIVGEDRLIEMLQRSVEKRQPLRIKYGIDATGREIHLGHAVPLFVLRRLQRMGHYVILLIGDFTARIGDPSGRIATRPVLSSEQIKQNASQYTAQAGKIIDLKKTEVRFNSEWLEGIPLARFFQIISKLTVSSAVQREDFRKRQTVTRAELLYSTLMGIDSVQLQAQIELGGDDQLLNFHDVAQIMQHEGLQPEAAVTTDLLLGTSGRGQKMSKSLNNFISVLDQPDNMFGKLMSIPDSLLEQYFKLLTDIRDTEWKELASAIKSGKLNPMQVKRSLARIVVSDLNDAEAAKLAEQQFDERIVKKQPAELAVVSIPSGDAGSWVAIVRKLDIPQAQSNAAARRLIEAHGVHRKVGDKEVVVGLTDSVPQVGEEVVLRLGKREYRKFRIS
jgi:tyrosyl-tRNA synthetase